MDSRNAPTSIECYLYLDKNWDDVPPSNLSVLPSENKRPLAVMKTHSSYRNQNLRRDQNDSWSTIVYSIDDDKK